MPGWNKNKKPKQNLWEDNVIRGKHLHNQLFEDVDQILTEKFSTFKYEIPKDKEQLLYDFYMSTLLGDTDDTDADAAVDEMKTKLYRNLKKEMLTAVGLAIASEFRHAFDGEGTFDEPRNHKGDLDASEMKAMDLFEKTINKIARKPEDLSAITPRQKRVLKGSSRIRIRSFIQAMKIFESQGISFQEFIKTTKKVFEMDIWEEDYGGDAWMQIADGWLRLYNAKDRGNLIAAIDHIYDLQHNNDSVFEKVQSYYKGGEIKWLHDALEHKKHIKEPHELYDKISPQLKRLAAFVIKKNYGKTLEDYLKDTQGFGSSNLEVGDIVTLSKLGVEEYDAEDLNLTDEELKKEPFVILSRMTQSEIKDFLDNDPKSKANQASNGGAFWAMLLKDFNNEDIIIPGDWWPSYSSEFNPKPIKKLSSKELKKIQ